MKYIGPLLVVKDMEASKKFYRELFDLEVISDFGANATLTGGISLQTLDSWAGFIHKNTHDISFGGMDAELYFESEDYDAFLAKLAARPEILYVHPSQEHEWGQRAVRIFDPDLHIIEIGESLAVVVKRFRAGGMTAEETAARMGIPLEYETTLEKE